MSIVDKTSQVSAVIQAFVQTGLDTVESFHQSAAEVPVDFARGFGLGKAEADLIKGTHSRMLKSLYGAVGSTNKLFGDLCVAQAGEIVGLVSSLTGGETGAVDQPAPKEKAVATPKKKTAARTAKKKTKKKSTSSRSAVRAKRSGSDA